MYMGVDGFCGVCIGDLLYLAGTRSPRFRAGAGLVKQGVSGSWLRNHYHRSWSSGQIPWPLSAGQSVSLLSTAEMGGIFRFSQTPGENEQVGGCLTINLLPTSMELLPDPAETLCLRPRHPARDQGQSSVLCHERTSLFDDKT